MDIANQAIENKENEKAIEALEKALENNEFEAASILAMFYIRGLNVEENIDKGLEYLYLGEKNNDPKSISMLGDFYYNGRYLEKDINKAKNYYLKAYKLNEEHAIGMLGLLEYNNENYNDAVNYFKAGVALSDINSMYYLGLCSYNGYGMDKDYTLSFMLFDRLYNINNTNNEVIKYLADSYFNGYGVEQDFIKAKDLYSNLSDDESIFNLGMIYKNHLNEYEKAFDCFKKVKNERSQFEQALMLYNGLGIAENKNDAYFKFYACAMSKYPYSYPFIGDSYFYGYGVKKDYNEAIKWYNEALKENIPNQYLNIATVYFKQKKYDEAIENLLKEEDSLNKYKVLAEIYSKNKKYEDSYNAYIKCTHYLDPDSFYQVYKMLKKGKGVKKDKELANNYYLRYLEISLEKDNENK